MYLIENYRAIERIKIKKHNYIVLTGDDTLFLKDICFAFYDYFESKKIIKENKDINEKKLYITNFLTGEKEQISSQRAIFIKNNDLQDELELGSKTILHSLLSAYFKEKMPIEPSLRTFNTLLSNFSEEEIFEKLEKELSKFSEYKFDFTFKEFTPNDIIKKIEVNFIRSEVEYQSFSISNLDKLKLKLSLYDKEEESLEKIYIFYLPENDLSVKEQRELKIFFDELSKNSTVIVATTSKYLFDLSFDSLNIIIDKKLKNNLKAEEFLEKMALEYPLEKTKEKFKVKMNHLIKSYINDIISGSIITNKRDIIEDSIFFSSDEEIFLLLYFLKKSDIKYKTDFNFLDETVFSNYIKNNFQFF